MIVNLIAICIRSCIIKLICIVSCVCAGVCYGRLASEYDSIRKKICCTKCRRSICINYCSVCCIPFLEFTVNLCRRTVFVGNHYVYRVEVFLCKRYSKLLFPKGYNRINCKCKLSYTALGGCTSCRYNVLIVLCISIINFIFEYFVGICISYSNDRLLTAGRKSIIFNSYNQLLSRIVGIKSYSIILIIVACQYICYSNGCCSRIIEHIKSKIYLVIRLCCIISIIRCNRCIFGICYSCNATVL